MSVKYQDYYEILEVGREATEKEIKAAYRKMARKWHPDLHPAGDKAAAEEKFKKINEAYEVLKDPEKRGRYDQLGKNWQDGQDFQAPPDMEGVRFYSEGDFTAGFGSGFSDFFEMFFGGGPARAQGFRRRTARGEDLESEIALTIEEAYRGTTRMIRVSGGEPCPACGGSGASGGGFCPQCGGTGSTASEKTLEVKIPPGVREGSRIRLKGQGGAGLGEGEPGDLFLKVRLLPHRAFRLAGKDIESDILLFPEQALLGDRVTVQTIDGPVTVTVPPGSGAGKKLRLRGKGYLDGPKGRGDHYVRVSIDIPPNPGKREKELYQQLHDLRREGE
ncbi:MAG: J domain-containing protein [Firmicutes bacterium]|nr:J domain-containing protein [Bacillota bacterium]